MHMAPGSPYLHEQPLFTLPAPTSLVAKLPPPLPIPPDRLPPHALHLRPLHLIRPAPILRLILSARHIRPPKPRRRPGSLESLPMPPVLVGELLRARLDQQLPVLCLGVGSEDAFEIRTEHGFEGLGVGFGAGW